MAYNTKHQLDQSLKENSNDFRQNWSASPTTSTPIYKGGGLGKLTTKRYSLAAISQSPLVKPTKQNAQKNYNLDLDHKRLNNYMSTHINTQSPGYTSRVVQYSEEHERASSLQPKKYGLGNFPIVHFFKKDLPILSRKSIQINDSVNSSDLSSFNTPEHNKMLLEKIIRSGSSRSEVNTKSVLDALREISRKRIHSEEKEFGVSKEGKRMCLDLDNEINHRKGPQHKLPDVENKKTMQRSFPFIDELTASYSSMAKEDIPLSKNIEISMKSPKLQEPKMKESVDVQTQTLPLKPIIVTPVISQTTKIEGNENKKENNVKTTKLSPVKIFDDAPLEQIRRNKLNILMKAYMNKEDDKSKSVEATPITSIESTKEGTVAPISILTTSKSPQKTIKHVTFNIPNTTTINTSTDTLTLNPNNSNPVCVVTNTTTVLGAPIVSPSVSEPKQTQSDTIKSDVQTGSAITFKFGNTVSNSSNPITTSTSTLYTTTPLSSNALTVATTSSNNKYGFTSLDQNKIAVNPSSATPKETGGFKFDLTSPIKSTFSTPNSNLAVPVSTSVVSSSTFPVLPSGNSNLSFTNTATTTSTPITIPGFAISSTPNFSFSSIITTSATAPTFNNMPISSSSIHSSLPGFNFSSNEANEAKSFAFSAAAVSKTMSNNVPNFGFINSNSISGFKNVTSTTPQFPAVVTTTVTAPFNFSQSGTITNFGTSIGFNKVDTGFVAPNYTLPSMFDSSKNTQSIATTTVSTNAPVFIGNNLQSGFGIITGNKPTFAFGNSTSSSDFNRNSNVIAPSTTKGNIFGSFGAPSSTIPAFGTQPPTFTATTNASNQFSFGNTPFKSNPPSFGAINNEIAVTTTPINFIQTNNTFSSGFGSTNTRTTQAVAPFGAPSNDAFGGGTFVMKPQSSEVFTFGTNSSTKPAVFSFGAGEPAKTTFGFGSENKMSTFGANTSFGSAMATPAFGAVNPIQPAIPGMFNIGAGGSASPGRPRTQIKTKRKT